VAANQTMGTNFIPRCATFSESPPIDPAGAGQWLAALPDDEGKQNVVQNYVNNISYQYPEMAAPWAEAMTDPQQRDQAMQNVPRQWMRTDSTSAKAWITKSSLPDDVKQRLMKTQ
jgi:hypothetical protein